MSWRSSFLPGLFLWFPLIVQAQPALHTLLENGPTDKRINVVMLSEGFTEAELPIFRTAASRILNDLLETPPYSFYRTYFNGYGISVASSESGSDHPSGGQYRDTYFSTYYDCFGIQRLICIGGDGHSRVFELLQDLMPEYDIVLLVVNDTEYGGSGGPVAVTSIALQATEIAIHEIGHSFAGLVDEYGGNGSPPGYEGANATQETQRDRIRWNHWIGADTPLPTPSDPAFFDVVGLFEGAAYNDSGWYRPQFSCKMRSLGLPFCRICQEHHVGVIYDRVGPLESFQPHQPQQSVAIDDTLLFRVAPMAPPDRRLSVQWLVEGMPVQGEDSETFRLAGSALQAGITHVSARVTDDTDLVLDPRLRDLLEETVEWEVSAADPTGSEKPDRTMTYELSPHYPNPVASQASTSFFFRIPRSERVLLQVFDVTGRLIATVSSDVLAAGAHEVRWALPSLPPGLYVYRLITADFHAARKLIVLP